MTFSNLLLNKHTTYIRNFPFWNDRCYFVKPVQALYFIQLQIKGLFQQESIVK